MTWQMWTVAAVLYTVAILAEVGAQCPQDDPDLVPWLPGIYPDQDVIIDGESADGKKLLVGALTRLRSITITNGGKLVIGDTDVDIVLSVSHILIERNGEMHIGSEECPHESNFRLNLWGESNDTSLADLPAFGRKVLAVAPNGTLEIHGQWKQSWTRLTSSLAASTDPDRIIAVQDNVTTWQDGDRIVIASTDYSMDQAEEFTVIECPECEDNEVRIQGEVQYLHYSGSSHGVEMRAEVGLLTRNIKIEGEMETACYDDNFCEYFDYDTHGGQTQFLVGFNSVRIEGVELENMGQQKLGTYPIHFHRNYDVDGTGDNEAPAYARQLSIHNCFSRCVTVHSTFGLLVEDVVGYNTLGHCFFLEDGNEQRNVFNHNLGLVTKPGVLLPSDRSVEMCEELLDDVGEGYIPDADSECRGVSTFWITHPDNHLTNNAAAGSEDVGFFFVFHREPTGASISLLPPYHGERSALGSFSGNVAHSNREFGLLIDRGVKIHEANGSDPREFLALSDYARYMPHVNQDPLAGRVTAVIDDFTAYKNSLHGVFVRGGDISVQNSGFADNAYGLTFASEQTLPYDAGSHQEVTDSIFVGESANSGTNSASNRFFGRGADGQMRTMPQDPSFPFRGINIYDGPVLVEDCSFRTFEATEERNASAIGFYPENPGQNTHVNTIGNVDFDQETNPVFMGFAGNIFGTYNDDGDLTQILHDRQGDVTGVMNSFVVRPDNRLVRIDGCADREQANAAICTGVIYSQVYVSASTNESELTLIRMDDANAPITLRGANRADAESAWNIYQPVLLIGEEYMFNWNQQAPEDISLLLANFPEERWVHAAFCYPDDTTFNVTYDEWRQMEDVVANEADLEEASSIQEVNDDENGMKYFFDTQSGLLHLKLYQRYGKDQSDVYNYCASQGCQRIHIEANMVSTAVSDCR